jgi:hypothetical protein
MSGATAAKRAPQPDVLDLFSINLSRRPAPFSINVSKKLSLPAKNVSLAEKLKRSKDDRDKENDPSALHAGV